MKVTISKVLFFVLIILALLGKLTSPMALILGFLFNFFFSNSYQAASKKAISYLLKIAVVGLGFGMVISETLSSSKEGFVLTLSTIVLTLLLGMGLTKLMKMNFKLGYLITSGTSICGGSAIATIAPIIQANSTIISISIGTIFFLNSVALFIFPTIGNYFHMTQHDFGLWCAVAIHDTSSVVGAALEYGEEALKIATTVKLSRTLWIIPLSIVTMFIFKTKGEKIKFPYFILLFILAIIINNYHIIPLDVTEFIVLLAKRLLVVTLFLIGASISFSDLKSTGWQPLILGLCLWIFISIFSFVYITS